MYRLLMTVLVLLILSVFVFPQHDAKGCHVYVVDVHIAKKMADPTEAQLKECGKTPAKCGVMEFPIFQPTMEEEDLTTKTYKFPWAPLTITANVFVTDESSFGDSATLTITLAQSSPKGVQADENSAQAEIPLTAKNSAGRAKRYYRVNNKQFLLGLECHFGDL